MAIGINTLILMALALVVLAVMIYLVIKASSNPSLDCNRCKASFTQYCRICHSSKCSHYKIKDFDPELCDCLKNCGLSCDSPDWTCKELQNSCHAVGIPYTC